MCCFHHLPKFTETIYFQESRNSFQTEPKQKYYLIAFTLMLICAQQAIFQVLYHVYNGKKYCVYQIYPRKLCNTHSFYKNSTLINMPTYLIRLVRLQITYMDLNMSLTVVVLLRQSQYYVFYRFTIMISQHRILERTIIGETQERQGKTKLIRHNKTQWIFLRIVQQS